MSYSIGQRYKADDANNPAPSGDITLGDDLFMTSGGIIEWASDVNLYRAAANVLATDDDFKVAGSISVPRGLRMRGRRDTASTGTTTIVGVLRLDDLAIQSGRAYVVRATGVFCTSTVNGDRAVVTLRYTTDGSTPTTSSAIMPGGQGYQFVTVGGVTGEDLGAVETYYAPSGNETLSVLVCVARNSGTGTVGLFADTDHKLDLLIEDVGAAVSDTGTDI